MNRSFVRGSRESGALLNPGMVYAPLPLSEAIKNYEA